MKYTLLFVLATLFSLQSYGQDKTTEDKDDSNQEKIDDSKKAENGSDEKIEEKKKESKPKIPYRFMVDLHGGIGVMNYFGDVTDRDNTTVHRVGNRAGFSFGIGGNLTNWLDLNVDVLMGKLNGNENTYGEHRNFEAKVFTAGVSLTYNFQNFIRDPKGVTPFISVGVSYSDYDIYSDLQDADGNVYYYWDDNLIRNVDQSSPATDDIQILERDYEYETRLNEFPITSVAIPVGAGIDLNISRKFVVRFGAHYYFTTSDKIDNAIGGSSGFISNDGFLFTSLSLHFKFDPFKKTAKEVVPIEIIGSDLSGIEDEDSDGDGVSDFLDQCGGTPKGLAVNDAGCPADDDNDGIPNYRDKQLNTPSGKIVDANGVAISYKEIYEKYGANSTSLLRKSINEEWLFSQPDMNPKYTVHVGTYTNYDIPTQLKIRLSKMEGLQEHKVNDSISVFTVGIYNSFEAAEKKQNELIKSGIDEAFGVNQRVMPGVGKDLGVISKEARQKQPTGVSLDIENVVLTYGVELREYRLRIQLDKLSKLIAKHGVEMKTTTGGLKIYTIGSFHSFEEAEALRKKVIVLGVKNPEITARHNNKTIDVDKAREMEDAINGKKEGE